MKTFDSLTQHQQSIVNNIIQENGWMDFASYASIKPTVSQELLEFASKFEDGVYPEMQH